MSNRLKGKGSSRKRAIPKIVQTPLSPVDLEMRKKGMLEDDCEAYLMGELRILVGTIPNGGGLHLSISHPRRYPTWDEIKKARYELLPDELTFVMFLPPMSEYVNVHENCFHLHEHREPDVKIETDESSQITL